EPKRRQGSQAARPVVHRHGSGLILALGGCIGGTAGMAFWPRSARETATRCANGLDLAAELASPRAKVVQDDLAAMWLVSVLDEIDGLPSAEHGLPTADRDADADRSQHRLDVTWHVVGALNPVAIAALAGHQSIERIAEIAQNVR